MRPGQLVATRTPTTAPTTAGQRHAQILRNRRGHGRGNPAGGGTPCRRPHTGMRSRKRGSRTGGWTKWQTSRCWREHGGAVANKTWGGHMPPPHRKSGPVRPCTATTPATQASTPVDASDRRHRGAGVAVHTALVDREGRVATLGCGQPSVGCAVWCTAARTAKDPPRNAAGPRCTGYPWPARSYRCGSPR